jgi:F-type H+-transporting ATPase subunit gamma
METLESLSDALDTTKDIQSIVRTMKALSAVSIRQYERAENALADYAHTIDLGLAAVLGETRGLGGVPQRSPIRNTGREALIVIGSDRGLCGRYNEVISRFAMDHLSRTDTKLGVLGVRVAARIDAAGYAADTQFTVPGSIDGFNSIIQSVIIKIDGWITQDGVSRVRVAHNRRRGANTAQPMMRQLLPIPEDDLQRASKTAWPVRGRPVFRMEREMLLSWLIRERLFLLLYRSLAEALVSEHASRLATMQNAERNIKDRRENLSSAFRQKRQESITRELLDVIAGYEAAGPVD